MFEAVSLYSLHWEIGNFHENIHLGYFKILYCLVSLIHEKRNWILLINYFTVFVIYLFVAGRSKLALSAFISSGDITKLKEEGSRNIDLIFIGNLL